jgi:hypothetical protein
VTRLLRLYPRSWRARYGAELGSLLEERPPRLADRLDLIRGAFDAHRHPELVVDPRAPSHRLSAGDVAVTRRLGLAGIAGAAAWALTWFVMSASPLVHEPGGGSYRDGSGALPILLLAGVLLIAALGGQLVMLPRSARVARAGAVIAIPGILLWTVVPWYAGTAAVAVLGLGLLAYGAWFARAWPWQASIALLLMVAAEPFIAYAGATGGPIGAQITPALALFILVPLVAWLTVGGTLFTVQTDDSSGLA